MYYDPEFYCYLKRKNAHELLFCYRWLLLDLKREFPFEDALRSLEVIWSSIPPKFTIDLPLYDVESKYHPVETVKVSSFSNHPNIEKFCNDLNSRIRRGRFDEEIFNRKLEAEPDDKSSSLESSVRHVRKSRIDDDMNLSSGRGSMSASLSSERSPVVNRPLRKIRFLPQLLSTDSHDIESPEDEDISFTGKYAMPPKFIEKQLSIDYEEQNRRIKDRRREEKFTGSFESEELRRVRSFDSDDGNRSRKSSLGSLSPKRRAQLARFHSSGKVRMLMRQKNYSTESDAAEPKRRISVDQYDGQELIAHCNGESDYAFDYQNWRPPVGLARSASFDSLRGSQYFTPVGSYHRQDSQETDSTYKSTDGRMMNSFDTESRSSSCSSLVILSSNGLVLDYPHSSPLTSSQASFRPVLPSPSELDSSNAFMLFTCLTLLLQHRDTIMNRNYDLNEIAMFFDSMVRKHKVTPALETARQLFHSYLSQWHRTSMEEAEDAELRATFSKFPVLHPEIPQPNHSLPHQPILQSTQSNYHQQQLQHHHYTQHHANNHSNIHNYRQQQHQPDLML